MFRRSRSGRGRAPRARSPRLSRPYYRKPLFELLEDRRLLATFTVTSNADTVNAADGVLTLREAIALANATPATHDTIEFAPALNLTPTIQLSNLGALEITSPMTIDASSLFSYITIRAFDNSGAAGDGTRVFTIDDGNAAQIFVTLDHLILADGDTAGAGNLANGGAIFSAEDLTIFDTLFFGNRAAGMGGAIFSTGTLSLNFTEFSDNTAETGGGVAASGTMAMTSIFNSSFEENTATLAGGGVWQMQGRFDAVDTTFFKNTAGESGGGIFLDSVDPWNVESSTFDSNTANDFGGGLFVRGSTGEIVDSTIATNSATTRGGGLYLDGGTATITHSTITKNSATNQDGGGIFADATTTLNITGSTISDNAARFGAGLYLDQSTTTVTTSTISGNRASFSGGGIWASNGSTTTIHSSTISANSALANGAGLDTLASDASIVNSTISGNLANGLGGGIYARLPAGRTLNISYSTITRNISNFDATGGGPGGGIYFDSGGGTANIKNSIIAGNSDFTNTAPDIDNTSAGGNPTLNQMFTLVGNNKGSGLAASALIGTPAAPINPRLGPLANNGGPTKTHALLVGSPAINTGDPAAIAGMGDVPAVDQRGSGFPRVADGRLDIGAFEFQQPPTRPTMNLLASSDTGMFNNDRVTNKMQPAFGGFGYANSTVYVYAQASDANGDPAGDPFIIGTGVVGSDATDGLVGNGFGVWEVTVQPMADGKYNFWARFDVPVNGTGGFTDAVGEAPRTIPGGPTTAIPANGVAVSQFTIASSPMTPVIVDLNVRVNITFPDDRDLTLTLISPSGTSILLANQRGNPNPILSQANFTNTVFDDSSNLSIAAGVAPAVPPFTGTFRPEEPLAVLIGEPLDGTWTLFVTNSGGNTGQIVDWELTIVEPIMVVIDTVAPNQPFLGLLDDTGRNNNNDDTFYNEPFVLATSSDPNVHLAQLLYTDNLKFRIYDRYESFTASEILIYDSALDTFADDNDTPGDMFTALTDLSVFLPQLTPSSPAIVNGRLADGVHNLKLVVEDRAGNLSHEFILTITVDTQAPPISFGLPDGDNALDGLMAESDTGVVTVPETFADRITSDTTPKFWGRAEANSIVRLYYDKNNDGIIQLTGPDADPFLGQTTAIPLDGNDAYPDGYWEILSALDLNQLAGVPRDGLRRILATAEDTAGNPQPEPNGNDVQVIRNPAMLEIFIDTQGPQITSITPNDSLFDLFDPKPSLNGPTPLVNSLKISLRDLPARLNQPNTTINDFLYDAVIAAIAQNPGNFRLVGDHVGEIAIQSITVMNLPLSAALTAVASASQFTASSLIGADIEAGDFVLFTSGANDNEARQVQSFNAATGEIVVTAPFTNVPAVGDLIRVAATEEAARTGATAMIQLNFAAPLPDDRYTLTVRDAIVDPAGNRLDGESNAAQPQAPPAFPTGNGVPGGDFVARFTVDSRPEIGSWVAQDIDIDINGNFLWDPAPVPVGGDATNVDISWTLPVQNADGSIGIGGFNVHDLLFAGKFGRGQVLVGDDAIFIIDMSGSTADPFGGDPIGDQNNDGTANTILDAQIAAFKLLNQQLIDRGLGNTALVSIVAFDSVASSLDMDPMAAGVQLTTTPLADANGNGMRDVEEALMAITSGGGTNFEAPLQEAINLINTAGFTPGDGNVIFLSDGFGSGSFADEVDEIRNNLNMNLRAFGVGPGASLAQLLTIDPDAETFSNTNELLAAFAGGGAGGSGRGFDQLAAFGNSAQGVPGSPGAKFRWIIDTNSDGVVTDGTDIITIQPTLANFNVAGAIPVAGNFDGNLDNGDEIGLYNAGKWGLDFNRNFVIEAGEIITTSLLGTPIVGDFDGDGLDDLAVFNSNVWTFNLAFDGFSDAPDDSFIWGFPGVLDKPVAADMDGDGIDDVGLWVPRTSASVPAPLAEWYFKISNDPTGSRRTTGNVDLLDHAFTPVPFGYDISAEFGDSRALPIVGNFDPPVTGGASQQSAPKLAGDYNNDGWVNDADYAVWKASYGTANMAADGNGDGRVDSGDYIVWRNHMTTVETPRQTLTLPGDYNGDTQVTTADYGIWKAAYGTNQLAADGNGDGRVDGGDYVAWRNRLGTSLGGSGGLATFSAIEAEPAAQTLESPASAGDLVLWLPASSSAPGETEPLPPTATTSRDDESLLLLAATAADVDSALEEFGDVSDPGSEESEAEPDESILAIAWESWGEL